MFSCLPNKRPEVQLDIVPDEVCELDGYSDILGFVTQSVDNAFHTPLVAPAQPFSARQRSWLTASHIPMRTL